MVTLMKPRSFDPESRNVTNSPEAIAAGRFRELHPGERVLYTRLLRHGSEPVVVIAHGSARPPLRTHFLVDLECVSARELDEDEAQALIPQDPDAV